MDKQNYTSLDELPLTMCATDIAKMLQISRSGAYALMNSSGFPLLCVGRRKLVMRDKLYQWLESRTST